MKYILVTGVSRGVGSELTAKALKEGYNVIGISRSVTEEVSTLITKYPTAFKHVICDLAEADQISSQHIIPEDAEIIGFVNNAAMAYDDIITNLNYTKLEQMYRVNVFAPMMLTKLVIRNMLLNQTKGSIVHVSSISVHTGYKGLAMYASTKGALEAFSKNTAREWGSRGIRSNCLVAGFMNTDMSASLTPEQKDRIFKRTSLKTATDVGSVADTILYLLSEKAGSITGQNIHVDNGTI